MKNAGYEYLSLLDCREIYEVYKQEPMPDDLPYEQAARMVLDDLGEALFVALLEKVRNARNDS